MRRSLLVVLTMLLFAFGAMAQTLTSGDLSGTVTDPQGAVVPNATVSAQNAATGAAIPATKTNASGAFHLSELQPGTYQLTVSAAGFNSVKRTAVVAVSNTTNV